MMSISSSGNFICCSMCMMYACGNDPKASFKSMVVMYMSPYFLLASHISSVIMFECSKQPSLDWMNPFWLSSKSLLFAKFMFWRQRARLHVHVRYRQDDIVSWRQFFNSSSFPRL